MLHLNFTFSAETAGGVDDGQIVEGLPEEAMGPPSIAGTSSEGVPQINEPEEMLEGDSEVYKLKEGLNQDFELLGFTGKL